jgi:hypothetical protein
MPLFIMLQNEIGYVRLLVLDNIVWLDALVNTILPYTMLIIDVAAIFVSLVQFFLLLVALVLVRKDSLDS